MGFIRKKYIKNGNGFSVINIYQCDRCKELLPENYPHYRDNVNSFCYDCAFILNEITEKQYLSCYPVILNNMHAEVIDGEIVVWIGNIHPLDKKRDKLDRRCSQYRNWRKSVFEKDNYQCVKCKSNVDLEAHHIKEFSKYKKLRFDVNNGITLCKKCHKEIHRKR